MGHKEQNLINIRLKNLPENKRLFRINSGMGWTGESTRKGGFLIIKNPRPLHAAPEGWPDLCGWTSIKITPDMVGLTVAIFTAEEVKATGKLSEMQEKFRDIILRMGGIFKIISGEK